MTVSKEIKINIDMAMDVEQLTNGGFSPLTTFLNYEELDSVLNNMRLPNGSIWPIPILFPVENDFDISDISKLILNYNGHQLAILESPEIFDYNISNLINSFFGTDDILHPGVKKTMRFSGKFITGKLSSLNSLPRILGINSLSPEQIKKIIKQKKLKTIVGFHTRNPPHKAHEYIHQSVLKKIDGLLLHPVIGSKKKGDFSSQSIISSYEMYFEKFVPQERVILSPLLTYSRYGGPKEAIFTAIVRKNYGCTHFVVGRDHTGVKNFYGKYDSQKIFNDFDDIEIEIIPFSEPFYCSKTKEITTKEECKFGDKYYQEISATKIRKAIIEKSTIPDYYIRKEILNLLQNMHDVFV